MMRLSYWDFSFEKLESHSFKTLDEAETFARNTKAPEKTSHMSICGINYSRTYPAPKVINVRVSGYPVEVGIFILDEFIPYPEFADRGDTPIEIESALQYEADLEGGLYESI